MSVINEAKITDAQEELRRMQLRRDIEARYPDTDRADGSTRGETCSECEQEIECCSGCHNCPDPECGECGESEDDCTCNEDPDD